MQKGAILFLLGFALFLAAVPAGAVGLIREDLVIPAVFSDGGSAQRVGLSALMVRPEDGQRHPLVVINHGSPREASVVRSMTPYSWYPEAAEFARRGWTAVVVMRRGYGTSGGEVEKHGPCQTRTYEGVGLINAEDIRQAIRYLGTLPSVDPSRVISVGVSAGGFATVALSTNPPPGLVAAISFAGGRGSAAPDQVCNEPALVDAFRAYGLRSRLPMLWIYAENDHFFGPALARRMVAAFTAGGGNVSFVAAPSFGDDGHHLFSESGIPLWTPMVDAFLAAHGLRLRPQPMALGRPNLPVPPGLSQAGAESFEKYLVAGPHKVFAVSPTGAYGWRTGQGSEALARTSALEACQHHSAQPCRVYAVDEQLVQPIGSDPSRNSQRAGFGR